MKKMNIKEKIKASGFYQWQVAEAMNVNEWTFMRWMRRPEKLSREKIDLINAALEQLKKEKEVGRYEK